MSRRSFIVLVGVYLVIAVAIGIALGWVAGLVVAFMSALVIAIGLGALVGGDWFRDASAGRFRDERDRS